MTAMAIAERNGDAEAAAECCSSALTETTLPQQRLVDGKVFPLVLSPSSSSHSAHQACKLLESNRALLEQKLKEHGAVFLRGFPLQNGADLQSVVDALGWLPVPYLGSAPRTQVAGSVYTANDSNPDLFINYHHEMSLIETTDWPSKLLFFCELPSSEGGQTPIIVSHKVTQSLWMRCPDFMQKLEELGLFYIKVLPMEMDPKHYSLQGWPLAFGTSNQKEAEERAKKNFNAKAEWLPGGKMKLVIGPFKGTRNFGQEGVNVWFNSIVAYHPTSSDKVGMSSDHPYDVVFGDGSPLPDDAVEIVKKIQEENSVDIPWQQGDLMIVDNTMVMHGRRAYKPPRRILVTLCR